MNIGKPNLSINGGFAGYAWSQRRLILIWLSVSFAAFTVLKLLFPNADFFSDSFSYVQDAVTDNHGFGFRPQGYPDFLYGLHAIYPYQGFVVFVQVFLFLLSSFLCLLTCGYLFGINNRKLHLIAGLILLNPVLIFIANLVSSDSLFCSLTVFWFTSLLWAMKRPTWSNLLVQALLLLMCVHVRYTGMFYFAISIIAFIVANGKVYIRITGIILSASVVFGYMQWQENKIEEQFDVRIFSGFSNWQIANNALCYYKKLDVQTADMPTEETALLDLCVKRYIDTVYTEGHLGTQYMWNRRSPLRLYVAMRSRFENKKFFGEWIKCSVEIGEYGRILVKHDPLAYVRYFMFPNFKNFMVPDLEALENYNIYNLTVPNECREWYNMDTNFLSCRFLHLQEKLMFIFPYVSCLLNLLNIGFIPFFLLRNLKRWKTLGRDIKGLFIVWSAFYIGYMFFSVASAYIVFRYLDIIFIPGVIIPVVLYPYCRKTVKRDGDPKAAISIS